MPDKIIRSVAKGIFVFVFLRVCEFKMRTEGPKEFYATLFYGQHLNTDPRVERVCSAE